MKIYAYHLPIGWKHYFTTVLANGAFAVMTNGAYVFGLKMEMPTMLKLSITIEER